MERERRRFSVKPCGGVVFIIDTSASMLNGDFGPSRWVAQKTLVQNICDSILSGSPEKQLSSFFGLVHSNTSKTALGVLPCKGNYLSLMESLESLTYNAEEDNSIDLSKSLRLLKLSLKQEGRAPPRVVILTSSVPSCEEPLVKISDKVGRVDCIYLRGANENAEEEADMREYCAQHFGKLLCLDPFDAYGQETWEWQEDLLCQLALSHKERSCPFDFNAEEGSTRFSHQRGLRFPDPHGKSRSTMKMVDSCRGESLDSYQHLSSDGFAHSWLPSYSNLAKKYEEKVLPGAWYLVIMDSLCKWQTVFSCKAGRMVSKASRHEPGKRVLEPRPRRGLLKLLYSADIDSWCMQWKQDDESEVVQGLPPLVAREREPEDELSIRFTGPSKIKLEAVPCETGEVIGAHLVSTPYKRQHVFFWLQEEFTSEHGGGAKGLVRKLEDAIRKEGQEHTSSSRNPLLTIGSEKIQFESVLLNLMSSCNSKTQQARCPISGKRGDGGMLNAKESNESEMGAMEEEDDLDKGFYSWTAKLDADLTDVERKLGSESNLAQMQTSHKAPPTAAGVPPGTEVNEEDSSMLFELD
ncbi:VWFA domain-containing protein [Chloropicon primus]|uniref:Uncharacterized protein n=1 Tax=Chloropicon primus TaxID=1764295 RepID=A0A5B8MKU0_9CHLO|nr:hypothetical protein A3770_05p35910 [Chloropicon primus]UPR00285.1 VWFA domain-containing protein [Chloropicon primus]|eukprot:QDZ21073.1 hypothetical protein A3770_05p35910 [Chloropicon primus]